MKNPDIPALCDLARRAGQEILRIAETPFTVDTKSDESPVTLADKTADALIRKGLAALSPDIPILSEESAQIAHDVRKAWTRYWLVDPLDGTKEFIKKNGEFTVNIALMEKNSPVLGVIHVPIKDTLYYGGSTFGAFCIVGTDTPSPIHTRKPAPGETVLVGASRSHPDPHLNAFLESIPPHQMVIAGSAYKFCLLAQGDIHLYPRFNPTMEWDTAAGQALVEGAGGSFTTPDGDPFPYNKPSLVNGPFLARA